MGGGGPKEGGKKPGRMPIKAEGECKGSTSKVGAGGKGLCTGAGRWGEGARAGTSNAAGGNKSDDVW